MKLFRRPRSPYWWADLTVGGKRHRFSTLRTDKGEATAVAAKFASGKLDAHQLGAKPELRFGEAVERWLQASRRLDNFEGLYVGARRLTGRAFDKETLTLRDQPDPTFAGRWSIRPDTLLSQITTQTVEMLKQRRLAEGLSPGTVNNEVAYLQRIYNMARKVWDARVDPNVEFARIKVTPKLRYLTVEEEAELLRELDPDRPGISGAVENLNNFIRRALVDQRDLVIFLLDTGARYSEIASITWDCIDTAEWKRVNIYRDKVGNEGLLTMTTRLREILQRRWAARPNSPYVFTGFGDTMKPRSYATKGIRAAMQRAGINAPHKVKRFGKATVHSFRDTFASRLVQAGVSLFKVQKLLGHSNPQQTQKYAHLAPDAAADEAAAVLDHINGGSIGRAAGIPAEVSTRAQPGERRAATG